MSLITPNLGFLKKGFTPLREKFQALPTQNLGIPCPAAGGSRHPGRQGLDPWPAAAGRAVPRGLPGSGQDPPPRHPRRGGGRPPACLDFPMKLPLPLRAASPEATPRGSRRGRLRACSGVRRVLPGRCVWVRRDLRGPSRGSAGAFPGRCAGAAGVRGGAGRGAGRGGARCRAAAGTRGSAPQKGTPRWRERAVRTSTPAEASSVRSIGVGAQGAAVGCGAAAPAPAEAAPGLGRPYLPAV